MDAYRRPDPAIHRPELDRRERKAVAFAAIEVTVPERDVASDGVLYGTVNCRCVRRRLSVNALLGAVGGS